MNSFLLLFSIITAISVLVSGGLLLVRRWFGDKGRDRDHIQSSVFNFFTTLYAFFIGFAIVTLWSAFLHAKSNVTKEADAIMSAHRISRTMDHSEVFRQALLKYVQSVIEEEWPQMDRGAMSQEANRRFEGIWEAFYRLDPRNGRTADLYSALSEVSQHRLSRAIILEGNLYPPVGVILVFGFVAVIFGLYFINREQTAVSVVFEFMVIFLVLSCLYFIYDIDMPFGGFISVNPEAFRNIYLKMTVMP